ncbi:MAG: sigma 54-interacting transcriptional regulator [Bacteroidetes bacterium]|nr:sigma 54-interacting transcriptional regulator [Bacteroidota bacterium]
MMKKFETAITKRIIIRLCALLVAALIIFVSPKFSEELNTNVQNVFYRIGGEEKADTNIVLINITKTDIENLGGWPLKRSYYALLINYLSKYSPSKIGIEIFLSSSLSSQNLYNSLLESEIRNTSGIVLASQLQNINFIHNVFETDSIEYPVLKESYSELSTGFLNYLEDDGYIIPTKVNSNSGNEHSFSSILAGKKSLSGELVKINLNKSWRSYSSLSLIEFFTKAENNPESLANLKDKIIIIGVSDPSISRSLKSAFDDQLPGIGFHAIALDNLLNDDTLIFDYKSPSLFFYLILFSLLAVIIKLNRSLAAIALLSFTLFLLSFAVFTFFGVQTHNAFLVTASVLILASEAGLTFFLKGIMLEKAIDEKDILELALNEKEKNLANLQKELELHPNSKPQELIDKIGSLKRDIDLLTMDKKDELPARLEESGSEIRNFYGMIFTSAVMEKVVSIIKKIAPQKATILILGESGSGKELVAKAVHELSERKNEKFVAVNCAALSDTLLESELFGHVKGSFTNAVAEKAGMFEAADKGTIFLDEIGETSENFQVKLLRVLQSGEIQKVGSTESKFVNVRVVAATNKDLESLVKQKKFREDLFYRLNVIQIKLPSLRERKEDIAPIADYFVKREEKELELSKAVIESLCANDWKGNIRELESVIKRAVIFAKFEDRRIIKLSDLPEELSKIEKSSLENLILNSLREKQFSHSSINETAKELGGLNRTIVSENFRGIFFRHYSISGFNLNEAVKTIAASVDKEILQRVESKGEKYLSNITNDISKHPNMGFGDLKIKFSSKYKNLPQKYHSNLDELIIHLISKTPEK